MTGQVEIPAFVWGALQLAGGTIATLVDPEHGILTQLKQQGVGEMYEAVCAVDKVLRETIEGASGGGPWDSSQAEAMLEFLAASMAVWREIDLFCEGKIPMGVTEAQASERLSAAWDRYRDQLDKT